MTVFAFHSGLGRTLAFVTGCSSVTIVAQVDRMGQVWFGRMWTTPPLVPSALRRSVSLKP